MQTLSGLLFTIVSAILRFICTKLCNHTTHKAAMAVKTAKNSTTNT